MVNSTSTIMAGARGSMDLCTRDKAPTGIRIHAIAGRDEGNRRKLKAAVEKTNQDGPFQEMGGHAFELVQPKKDVICGFPITMVKCKGRMPKNGTVDAHDVQDETFMFFEDQSVWNKKYLTYDWSEKEK